jgi:succinate dehydrogenase/fumarate reductase flavoprotein subunit
MEKIGNQSVQTIESDVLCVGGGIAGLMAAIRAREMGASVVVAEKGNALYSGRGRSGNDHFWCYIPEVHGSDIESFLKECLKGPKLRIMQSGTSMKVLRTFLENSFEVVKLWDSWGIPMKYDGKWEFAGHSFPGDIFTHLKYKGRRQKKVLTNKALEKGATIVNSYTTTTASLEPWPSIREKRSFSCSWQKALSSARASSSGSIPHLCPAGWQAHPAASH